MLKWSEFELSVFEGELHLAVLHNWLPVDPPYGPHPDRRPREELEEKRERCRYHCSNDTVQRERGWKAARPDEEARHEAEEGRRYAVDSSVENWREEA